MPSLSLTDFEIDARARAFAIGHRVNYSEALSQVVAFAEAQAPASATPTRQQADLMDDAELDAEARRTAVSRGLDYASALQIAVESRAQAAASAGANFSEQKARAALGSLTDFEIDARARAYALSHRVNYSEALSQVAAFAEAQAPASATPTRQQADLMGDAELDAEARRTAISRGLDYASALQIVVASRAQPGAPAAANFSEQNAQAALGNGPWEIFRTGSHGSLQGPRFDFTLSDVQAIARNYAPDRHEAPLIVGQPRDDKPAYGWVKRLEATPDGRLLMWPQELDPTFADMVRQRRFTLRRVSFYQPQDRSNPTPGSWYLRNVSWDGAPAPEVPGLRTAPQFSEITEFAPSFELGV